MDKVLCVQTLHTQVVKSANNIPQQSCITQATEVTSGIVAVDERGIGQATRVARSAAFADEECIAQSMKLASDALIGADVLELIEVLSHHEFFIEDH